MISPGTLQYRYTSYGTVEPMPVTVKPGGISLAGILIALMFAYAYMVYTDNGVQWGWLVLLGVFLSTPAAAGVFQSFLSLIESLQVYNPPTAQVGTGGVA